MVVNKVSIPSRKTSDAKTTAKTNENDQIFGDSGGTSDAKQQQKPMKMIKSLVIQEGSK